MNRAVASGSAALFGEKLRVLNVGIAAFADSIAATGGEAVQVDWRPPGQGDPTVGRALAALVNREEVEAANAVAFKRYLDAQPVLEGVGTARDHIPALKDRTLLHAGPPIQWRDMCGPMQGAVIGAIVLEGWADSAEAARKLAANGSVAFLPNHEHGAVGPMAGVISPSMPVWIVRNAAESDGAGGNRAYCNLNEGLGKVLRMGAHSAEVLQRLRWMGAVLAPALAATLHRMGPLELKPLMAQALHMGDEVHNRNVAATSLFLRKLVPPLLAAGLPNDNVRESAAFIAGNDHFFLNLSMAACKASLDAAQGVAHSSLVTAMARNGVEFGVRVSGTGGSWFTAPAPVVDGLYFPGYSKADAAPDLGDSAITETAGLGGFAMATAPAIVQFVGGSADDALAFTREMSHITLGRNPAFTLPALNFVGTPAGIDARKVVDTGIAPVINTGIAHREAGIGQVGAGITRAPLACLEQAVLRLAEAFPDRDSIR
jgi:hypothetical protein